MQSFFEAMLEAFRIDPETGCFAFKFGENEEYSLEIEPLFFEQFHLALYQKGGITGSYSLVWPDKIPIKPGYTVPKGPGEEEIERRKIIRKHLETIVAAINKADAEALH